MSALTDVGNTFSSNDPTNYNVASILRTFKTPQEKVAASRNLIEDTFKGFDTDFYNARAQAYVDFALPKLAEQLRTTQSQLGYGMGQRGLAGSSMAKKLQSSLSSEYLTNQQGVADTALSQANALRKQIDTYKSQLLTQVYEGARPGDIQQQAYNIASQYKTANPYSGFANAFSDWMSAIGKQNWFTEPYTNSSQSGSSDAAWASTNM